MLYGKLPNNLETTQCIKNLREICSTTDYPLALLLHLRFGMASGRSEESDGVLPRAQAVGLHEGSRRVANRLIRKLVQSGTWEDDGVFICDLTWTQRYRTHEQISERRQQVREAVAALRQRSRQASDPPCPTDADCPLAAGGVSSEGGGPTPHPTVVRRHDSIASNEQNQALGSECNPITLCTDTDLTQPPVSAPAAQQAAGALPKTGNPGFLSSSNSVLCPRETHPVEDLQGWLAQNGLGLQMTGKQVAEAGKLGTTTAREREAALKLAQQWAERDGVTVTPGRVLRCLADYRASYEAEMRRPMSVDLSKPSGSPRAPSRALGRITEAGIAGTDLLRSQIAKRRQGSNER